MLIRENLHSQIDDLHNLRRGSFILGGTTLIISHVLPQVLKDFGRVYPDVEVKLQVEPSTVLWDKLAHGQVDIVIDNVLTKDPDHEYIPLFREHILIGVPADNPINEKLKAYALDPRLLEKPGCDYSRLPRLNIKQLENEEFILLKPGNKMRQIAHNIFTEQGVSPKIRFEFDRLTTSINFAESGFGICFLTDTNLQYGTCKNLVFYQPDAWDADRHLYVMYKKNKYLSTATKTFIDFLKKSF
jgi:DNA-binding transcriptional LysR family regulator